MPPVVLASAQEGQTRAAFEARAARPAPATATATAKVAESCTHAVVAGDTLGEISSSRLGTAKRWREIVTLNPGLKPGSLQIGSVLKIPCSVGDGAGEGGAGSPPARAAPRGGGGLPEWLRKALGGPSAEEAARPEAPASQAKAEAVEEEPAPPPLPPPPVWTAAQGEFLADVLARWGETAGWTVIVDTTDAWRLHVAFRTEAAFDAAVAELVRGMGHDGVPPMVRLYPNNVLRLGGPL